MSSIVHTGDCLDVLPTLPEASAHCIVTSPPYFGLRDYGIPPSAWPEIEFAPMAGLPAMRIPPMMCCLGLEPDPWAFVGHLVHVFRIARRVLRDDGTLWLNLGDSYAGSWGAEGRTTSHGNSAYNASRMQAKSTANHPKRSRRLPGKDEGLKPKDLIGIPWRVALALQADGWFLRQDIIWSKPNPMPESVRDRCTKAHEYVFLLSKGPRYYFDQEAIAEQLSAASIERLSQPGLAEQAGSDRVPGKTNGTMKAVGPRFGGNKYGDDDSEQSRTKSGNVWVGGSKRYSFARETKLTPGEHGQKAQHRPEREDVDYCGRRNKRSVWTVATVPFKEAHFATYPPALIEPCILAGAPAGGVVLDVFGGSGTTGEVAIRLGRDAVLIELKPENVAMAERRTSQGGLPLAVSA